MNKHFFHIKKNKEQQIEFQKTETEWNQYKEKNQITNNNQKDNFLRFGTIYGTKYGIQTDFGDWDNQFTISKESDSYYIEDGKTSVQDNPSGNHTTVNGKDITGKGKVELNDGDTIGLATVLDVTFRMS